MMMLTIDGEGRYFPMEIMKMIIYNNDESITFSLVSTHDG